MNTEYFGKIIAFIGLGIIALIFIIIFIKAQGDASSLAGYGQPSSNISASYSKNFACLFGRISDKDYIVGLCPLGGYSAIFSYIGTFVALVGGALFLASRKPKTPTK